MREKAYRWAFWAAAVAVIAVINAVDTWGAIAVAKWAFGNEGAAWVQAVGSVAAIAFGFWYSEHRLQIADQQKVAKDRRTLIYIATELLDYLNRANHQLTADAWATVVVDDATFDGWQSDIRSIDSWLLDRLDRGRYATLRHHLRTIGHRMTNPVSKAMTIEDLNEMSKHLWDHIVKPLNEAGAMDARP